MKMIHATFKLQRLREKERWKSKVFVAPIKVKKVNIGKTDNLKMASIGDYWDEQTLERIVELLCEYSDMFPTNFIEIKSIA